MADSTQRYYCSLFGLLRPVVVEVFTKTTLEIFNVM